MGLIFLALIFFVFCSSCSVSWQTEVKGSISEIREFVLAGNADGIYSDIMCGYREVEYVVDGYSNDLIPFGVLTIRFDEDVVGVGEGVFFSLFVGTIKYNGECEKNPFDGSYAFDIKTIIDKSQNVLLEVKVGNNVFSMKLNSAMSDWVVNCDRAFDIFMDKYSKELKGLIHDGVFMGEVYIKIVGDYNDGYCEYLYYVNCVGRMGESVAIMISPKTGNILATTSNMQSE